jgi:pyridoxal phosphate enzyme (YggS family)
MDLNEHTISGRLSAIRAVLPEGVRLVAVSKFHPIPALQEAYEAGQRLFGENRPQEFAAKVPQMPSDVEWHFIGHLQTNKLKLVLPYAAMVQSVDSIHLLDAIQQWGATNNRIISVLLELHLGAEETKHGLTEEEITAILDAAAQWHHIRFCGLMGMATNTEDEAVIRAILNGSAGCSARFAPAWPPSNPPLLSPLRPLLLSPFSRRSVSSLSGCPAIGALPWSMAPPLSASVPPSLAPGNTNPFTGV